MRTSTNIFLVLYPGGFGFIATAIVKSSQVKSNQIKSSKVK